MTTVTFSNADRCPLLEGMQLTYIVRAESLNTRDDGREETYRSCQKHNSITAWSRFLRNTGGHLLGVSFVTSLKSHYVQLDHTIITRNNCIIALALSLSLTHTHKTQLHFSSTYFRTDTTKVQSAFPSANHCQGQLKTPQSLSVVLFAGCSAISYLLQHVPAVRNCPGCKCSTYSIHHYCANCSCSLVFKTRRRMMRVHKIFDTGLENPLWLVVFLIT